MSDPERAWRTAYRHPTAWETHFPPQTMVELFDQACAEAAARPLIDFLGRTYSYAETLDGANRVASGLKAMGSGAGDRIGLFLRSEEHTSELPSLMRIQYDALCLKKQTTIPN